MGTINGVTTSKVTAGKWTHWGELAGIDYVNTGNSELYESETVKQTLRKGSKGDAVRELQTMLLKLGYDLGPCGIDGDFGKATEAAVRSFQSDHRLAADGICGAKTWAELEKSVNVISVKPKEVTYCVTIGGLDLTQAQALIRNYPGSVLKED
ncbi:MAG: peptidoglycan-binding protein [Clostridia bacterium]|nr:peptidoglycan-binding protein [Clostridia bacterium]